MARFAMFENLVYDEAGNPLEISNVGGDAFYVVDDDGFHRHIDAEEVDRKVVAFFVEQLQGNQDIAVEQMMKMTGQDDLMAKAAMDAQIRNVNVDDIVGQILPQQARDMLGMMGFRIIVNYHGEIVRMDQPSAPYDEDDY